MNKRAEEDQYDSDLNRTMFAEFWTDLKEFKPKEKKVKKKRQNST